MAKIVTNIATKVSLQVRRDGLYRSINHGQWSRIACRSKTLGLRFQHRQILIDDAPLPRKKARESQSLRQNRRRVSSKSAVGATKRNSNEAVSEAVGHKWHAVIGDPTYADAILDRLVHNAQAARLGPGQEWGRYESSMRANGSGILVGGGSKVGRPS